MKTAAFIRIGAFSVISYLFIDAIGSTEAIYIFDKYPLLWAFLGFVVLAYIGVEVSNHALNRVLFKSLTEEEKIRYQANEKWRAHNRYSWIKNTYKKLLGSKPIEQEGEIILDHSYDGIRELDNKLPPWWVYGFYATILFAAIYLSRYHLFGGVDQAAEYEIAMNEANLQIEEYKRTAKDLVDINTVEALTDASDLKAGETIFTGNCIACHKVGGGGGIGPNLTDDHWLLGGGIKNIFRTISEGGRAGKGMISWKSELKPSEMAQVASYVLSLHGTNPIDPKEPEGEIWIDTLAPIEEVKVQIVDSTEIEMIIENQPVTGDVVNDSIQ